MLTDQARAILDFEERWIDRPWGRETAIRAEFGLTRTWYTMRLNQVISNPDAVAERPQLIYRLQARHAQRVGRRNRALLRRDE